MYTSISTIACIVYIPKEFIFNPWFFIEIQRMIISFFQINEIERMTTFRKDVYIHCHNSKYSIHPQRIYLQSMVLNLIPMYRNVKLYFVFVSQVDSIDSQCLYKPLTCTDMLHRDGDHLSTMYILFQIYL